MILLVSCAAAGIGAARCAGVSEELRAHTYPPEFRYLPKETVKQAMWTLADNIQAVDALLRKSDSPSAEDREAIVAHLAAAEKAATGLDGAMHTNRVMIDARMDDFLRDLSLARRAAEANPPNYFLAGSAAGSCLHCHGAGADR